MSGPPPPPPTGRLPPPAPRRPPLPKLHGVARALASAWSPLSCWVSPTPWSWSLPRTLTLMSYWSCSQSVITARLRAAYERRLRAHQPHVDLLGLELMVHRVGREDLALDLDGAGQRRRVGRRLRAALVVGGQADLEHHEPEGEAQQQDDQQRRDDLAVLGAHAPRARSWHDAADQLANGVDDRVGQAGHGRHQQPASATSIAIRASHSIVLCPLSAWRSIWGRAAARLRADIHRRRCRRAGTWAAGPRRRLGRPWAPSRTPASHQPDSRRRASASAPATAAATSTIPSITTVAGEAPSPPSDARVTSTISATGPKAPAKRAAAVCGAPLSAACHAPMAPAPAALTAQRAVKRKAVSVPRSAHPWPASPMKARDEEHGDEDRRDHGDGAGGDPAREPAAVAGLAEQREVAVGAHG